MVGNNGAGSGKPRKGPAKVATSPGETARVTRLLRRERQEAVSEEARATAEHEVRQGKASASDRAKLGPTPEQAAQFEPYLVDEIAAAGSRRIETVRRASTNRVKQLHDRGVFSDDTYPAVLWYQRMWEDAGFVLGASAASWGDAVRGEPAYGVMPKTALAAECREMFRFARGGRRIDNDGAISFEAWSLPADMLPTFDLVVLHEMTIAEAAAVARCRYSNAAAAVRHVALMLLGRIGHLLPVRAVGALGSEPAVAVDEPTISLDHMLDVLGGLSPVDPAFLDDAGLMRPWAEISEIILGRLSEGEG